MAYKFGISDARIATWNNDQNWGSAVDLVGVQMMAVKLDTVSGILNGDDEIKDVHAQTISATLRVRFAFNSLDVFAVLTGETHTDSGADETMIFGTTNMPYFGIVGRIDHTEGSGDVHFFCGKAKITDGFEWSAEYGGYITPELTIMAVYEGTAYGIFRVIEHGTAETPTIPPS